MNPRLEWSDYLRALSPSQSEIAQRAGTSQSTVSRWLSSSSVPDARQVIRLARAYDQSPVRALVAAGYLSEDEVTASADAPRTLAIREFTDLELAHEMVRRVDEGGENVSEALDAPLDSDHVVMRERYGNVTDLHDRVGGLDEDQLRERYATAANTDDSADRLDDETT